MDLKLTIKMQFKTFYTIILAKQTEKSYNYYKVAVCFSVGFLKGHISMVQISHLFKTYKTSHSSVVALKDVSLSVKRGEFVAIVGKSGSGKSSLMNILGCLDKPDSGSYSPSGEDVHKMSHDELAHCRREKIGFVFQSFNLLSKMSALENVALPLMYARVSPIEREKVAREALIKVGLGARISHRPFQMSGGQQQRVAVARALAGNPPLILADEPTGNLDSKSSDEILNLLLDANNAGHTVILITHDDKIARRANRVICISDGEIISDTIQ